eukprot:gene15807-19056_t
MTIGVMLLGTVISWAVVRTQATADITRRGEAPPAEITAKVDTEQAAALINIGAGVIQQRCAGCHDVTERLVAPSWSAVIERYKSVTGAQALNADALALMIAAITHPRPGWDGYAAGPTNIQLSEEQSLATSPHGVEPLPQLTRIDYDLLKAHALAAVISLFLSAVAGLLVALKLTMPELLGDHASMTWGRLRYDHTQGIFFGWLGNAFLACCYHMVPRLADRPVLSRKLGWAIFFLWNLGVLLPGWLLVSLGLDHPWLAIQSIEWAEFPMAIDVLVVMCLLMICAQFAGPFLLKRQQGGLYISAWYLIGGAVFSLLAYPVGNFVPVFVPGAQGAAFSGLWIHDAVGLFVTPFVLAIAYYVIPAATNRPIYSHFLSMIGFWFLFFFYPLNGTHHYVYSAIPMDAQKAAIIASVYLGMDVILVVFNQLMSLRGQSAKAASDVPLRFVWTGIVIYLIVSLQGAFQALMPVNKLTHFSDWVIGHSHLAMLGFATFVAAGGIAHAWQRIPHARYDAAAMNWAYWLITTGLLLMFITLTAGGLVQAQLWESPAPWMDSVRASLTYWWIRDLSAIPLLLGFIAFYMGLTTGPRNNSPLTMQTIVKHRLFNSAYLVIFVAGIGFFILSFMLLGILPGKELQKVIDARAPGNMRDYTPQEKRGRAIYGREGCGYCHTQQVRFVEQDLTHLFNPRYVVSDSVMPGYPWLFEGAADKPSSDGLALVAYLQSLGRARKVSGYDEAAAVPSSTPEAPVEDSRSVHASMMVEEIAAALNARKNPIAATPQLDGEVPGLVMPTNDTDRAIMLRQGATAFRLADVLWNGRPATSMPAWRDLDSSTMAALALYVQSLYVPEATSTPPDDVALGKALFNANCVSCHGANGNGDGPASRDEQRTAIVAYLRTLYQPTEKD